jgi:hypothetical protein
LLYIDIFVFKIWDFETVKLQNCRLSLEKEKPTTIDILIAEYLQPGLSAVTTPCDYSRLLFTTPCDLLPTVENLEERLELLAGCSRCHATKLGDDIAKRSSNLTCVSLLRLVLVEVGVNDWKEG